MSIITTESDCHHGRIGCFPKVNLSRAGQQELGERMQRDAEALKCFETQKHIESGWLLSRASTNAGSLPARSYADCCAAALVLSSSSRLIVVLSHTPSASSISCCVPVRYNDSSVSPAGVRRM